MPGCSLPRHKNEEPRCFFLGFVNGFADLLTQLSLKKRKGTIHNFTMNPNVCILSYAMFSCVFQLCSGFVVGIWFHLTSAQLQGQACQRPRAAAAPCRAAQVWFWCRMAMYGSVLVIPVLLYLTTRRFIMYLLHQMGPDIGTLSPAAPLRMSMRRAWVLFISQ